MKRLLLFGFVLLFPAALYSQVPNIPLPHHESFENEPADAEYERAVGYGIRAIPRQDCNIFVRDTHPARYGDNYLTIECTYSGVCADRDRVYRGDTVFGGFQTGSDTSIMDVNNGNAYWIGWSNFVPEDYPTEYFSHNFVQIIAANRTSYTLWAPGQTISPGGTRYFGLHAYISSSGGTTGSTAPTHTSGSASDGGVNWTFYRSMRQLVWIMRYGGEIAERQQSIAGHHKFLDNAGQSNATFDPTVQWVDYRGQWIDWALNVVWYDTDHPSAKFHLYMNGELVYGSARDGLRNIPTDRKPQWYALQCYQPFYGSNYACTDDPGGGSTRIKLYNTPHTRATFLDEFRFMDQVTVDDGDAPQAANTYCGITPPIWPAAPTISHPVHGSSNVSATFTVGYSSSAGYRTDEQSCFSRSSTKVQIALASSADWKTLVYENNSADAVTQQVTGLSEGTEYKLRVRHVSQRSGLTDTYTGLWSDTVTFTTEGDSLVVDTCSSMTPQFCTTELACEDEDVEGFWCVDGEVEYCSAIPCDAAETCAEDPDNCLTSSTCSAVGWYWWSNGVCRTSPEPETGYSSVVGGCSGCHTANSDGPFAALLVMSALALLCRKVAPGIRP